jgi:hypothetical protein
MLNLNTLKIVCVAAIFAFGSGKAIAQGTLNFSNRIAGQIDERVTGVDGANLDGPGYSVQLYAGLEGTAEANLAPVGPVLPFRTGVAAGLWSPTSITLESVQPGAVARLQARAWDNDGGSISSWESALVRGASAPFDAATGGAGIPPSFPGDTSAIQAFSLKALSTTPQPQVGNFVWHDLNQDGIQQQEEPGLEGVIVRLLACADNAVIASEISNARGFFKFEGALPEQVYLEIESPNGFGITARDVGEDDARDSDLDPLTLHSACIDLSDQSPHLSWDIGLVAEQTEMASPGVASAGFWKNHLEAWPVEEVTIGGITYSKSEAGKLLSNGNDKSKTMFRSLLSAKLNIANGSDASCVADTVLAADQWMAANGPVNSGVKGNSTAWKEGAPLHALLENYNNGELCAQERNQSKTPVAVSTGFAAREQGKIKDLRMRVFGEPGRIYLLQKSDDLVTWVDVATLETSFGIAEAIQSVELDNPGSYFRITLPSGPAATIKANQNHFGTFRELGSGEETTLLPVVYNGDLVVRGGNNTVTGQIVDEKIYTIIAGNLDIRGSGNKVSNLTVLGKVILRGNNNVLESVDYQGGVETTGNGNNEF